MSKLGTFLIAVLLMCNFGCRSVQCVSTNVDPVNSFCSASVLLIIYPRGSEDRMPPSDAFNRYEELVLGNVTVKQFPVLRLVDGAVQDVDDRTSYTFPMFYTEGGTNAVEEKTYQIGDYLHVLLGVDDKGRAQLDVHYEGATLERWEEATTSYGYKYRFPLVKTREFQTTINPFPGRWYEVGRIPPARGWEGMLMLLHFNEPALPSGPRDVR